MNTTKKVVKYLFTPRMPTTVEYVIGAAFAVTGLALSATAAGFYAAANHDDIYDSFDKFDNPDETVE